MNKQNNPFELTERLKILPPYVFSEIDRIKQEEIKKGRKLISLGIGDPDLPTPDWIIDRFVQAARKPANHQYPSYSGMIEFRSAVARWYKRRFSVELNPETEVLTCIGSKEGIAHIPLAFVNPGESTLVPDPGYPVYYSATYFAGGIPLRFTLLEKNGFLPDFSELEALIKQSKKTRILFLNYPNNPTSATASLDFFKEVVRFAKKHELIVCHDNAYSEIYFGNNKQPSFLEVPGAKDVGCEFHSLSKTYNMTGWRVGFCVGNEKIIRGLGQVKTNIDSGVFNAIQEAGILALDQGDDFCAQNRKIYERRRDILTAGFKHAGLYPHTSQASFYLWSRLPDSAKHAGSAKKMTSAEYVTHLIKQYGIVATPGSGFGAAGEGYVRFTLCLEESLLKQVAETLARPL